MTIAAEYPIRCGDAWVRIKGRVTVIVTNVVVTEPDGRNNVCWVHPSTGKEGICIERIWRKWYVPLASIL